MTPKPDESTTEETTSEETTEETTEEAVEETTETEETTEETTEEETSTDDSAEKLKGALDKERTAAKDARKQVKSITVERDALTEKLTAAETERDEAKAKIAEAEDKAEKAEARALRLEVAASKGLDLNAAPRLTGSTREELEADADDLVALVGAGSGGSLDGGARRKSDPKKGTPEQEHSKLIGRLLRGEEPEDD